MTTTLFPDDYKKSIHEIDFSALYKKGYRAVLFDVDNTLVPHNAPADSQAIEFFSKLRAIGFKTQLISNNKEPRVKLFSEAVGADGYQFLAGKPSPKGYRKAMAILGTDETNTMFVGDQIFTDIMGAKNAGIYTIMVEPVLKWKEEPQIVLKRFLEAPVIFLYKIFKGGAK